ncbi:hypothetical protein DFA_07924 [Cavenderia fasciculata]|uniref:EGF-like domain-containing protein n=1 Tax=Cavenderia fasciculata TaxID=261658 RepID=F4Q429_CACFS|nr:uncharacterized protein DFA_07924 [Cavenderia fasciculata]EGG16943.1 hypothetical protein DFA_07924 [Cavenderia fasciculata]|eukprot:XP_004355417.1 hypothetical protein DFA_07924 [Cavenderia fasciculata]
MYLVYEKRDKKKRNKNLFISNDTSVKAQCSSGQIYYDQRGCLTDFTNSINARERKRKEREKEILYLLDNEYVVYGSFFGGCPAEYTETPGRASTANFGADRTLYYGRCRYGSHPIDDFYLVIGSTPNPFCGVGATLQEANSINLLASTTSVQNYLVAVTCTLGYPMVGIPGSGVSTFPESICSTTGNLYMQQTNYPIGRFVCPNCNGAPCSNGVCKCPPSLLGTYCEKDVNECLNGNGGCQQTCTNSMGSFQCGCYPGYLLNLDSKTCYVDNKCNSNPCTDPMAVCAQPMGHTHVHAPLDSTLIAQIVCVQVSLQSMQTERQMWMAE